MHHAAILQLFVKNTHDLWNGARNIGRLNPKNQSLESLLRGVLGALWERAKPNRELEGLVEDPPAVFVELENVAAAGLKLQACDALLAAVAIDGARFPESGFGDGDA